jgi:hypothetical protein
MVRDWRFTRRVKQAKETHPNMQTESEKRARQQLADLKDKVAAAELRKVELSDQRDALAFNAHTGDATANKALAKITKELIEHEQHVLSLQAAVREGEQRVLIAQGHTKAQIEKANAEAALKLGRVVMDALALADKGLRDAFAALHDAARGVDELGKLGCPPSSALFSVNVRRAVASASQGTRFMVGQHLSPSERISLTELSDGWRKAIEHWAAQRLEKKEAA